MRVTWKSAARLAGWPPIWPHGLLGWPLFLLAGFTAYRGTFAYLPSGFRWAGCLALAGVFLWRYKLPAIPNWHYLPIPIRGTIVAGLGWVLMVSIGWLAGIGGQAPFVDFAMVRGLPWIQVHTAAACACTLLIHSQIYVLRDDGRQVAEQPMEDRTLYERGAILQTQDEVERRARAALGQDGPSLIWGFMPMPARIAPQNFLLIGAPQSGKTLTQFALMKSVLDRMKTGSNIRALIYDAKRDIYPHLAALGLADKVHFMNPLDARGSAWDIAADLHNNPILADEIAAILFPQKGDENPFFANAARELFKAVTIALCDIAPLKWTLRDAILALRSADRIRAIIGDDRAVDNEHLIEVFLGQRESNLDVQATVIATLNQLTFVAAAWWHAWRDGKRISLAAWAKSESILLLGSNPELTSMMQNINAVLFHRVTQLLRNQCEADHEESYRNGGPRRQTWLFIDELANAGKLPEFETLLSEARSKGVCTVAAFQSLPQLECAYPDGAAHALLATFGNRAFFAVHDKKTADYMSGEIGLAEVDEVRVTMNAGREFGGSYSHSSGESSSTTTGESWGQSFGRGTQRTLRNRPAVMAEDIMRMPLADPAVGIHAVLRTKEFIHSYCVHTSPQVVDGLRAKRDSNVEDFQERPPEHKRLKGWDEDDLKRLNLEGVIKLSSKKAVTPTVRPSLFDVVDVLHREAPKNRP